MSALFIKNLQLNNRIVVEIIICCLLKIREVLAKLLRKHVQNTASKYKTSFQFSELILETKKVLRNLKSLN